MLPNLSLGASIGILVFCSVPILLRAMSPDAASVIAQIPLLGAIMANRGFLFAITGVILAFAGIVPFLGRLGGQRAVQAQVLTTNGISTTVYAVAFVLAYLPDLQARG